MAAILVSAVPASAGFRGGANGAAAQGPRLFEGAPPFS